MLVNVDVVVTVNIELSKMVSVLAALWRGIVLTDVMVLFVVVVELDGWRVVVVAVPVYFPTE